MDEFVTGNYGVHTSPSNEYAIAKGRRPCPARDLQDGMGGTVRVVRRLEELMELKTAVEAKLLDDEVLAVVRAHGPVFPFTRAARQAVGVPVCSEPSQ